MSDDFGLIRLPFTGSFGSPSTTAIGDPALDKLAGFLKAAINADTRLAWAAVHPGIVPPEVTPVPVVFAHTHNPDDGEFTDNKLPALFLWRDSWTTARAVTSDWQQQVSRVAVLWVPPRADFEKARYREPFRNALAKAIHRNVERQRNPAWIASGDTDTTASYRGSFLLTQMSATKLRIIDIRPHPLTVEKGNGAEPYDALLTVLELTETMVAVLDDYDDIDHIEGNVQLYGATTTGLTINSFHFEPAVVSVTPSTGSTAGGTAITITGRQFFEDTDVGTLGVTIGGVACTSVVWVDETTLTAVTPAGTAGAKTLEVTLPSDATASLASAFTYS